VITPRITRLLRAPNYRAFQRAIALAAYDPHPLRQRDVAIIVPSAGAVDQLRHTLEELWLVEQWTPARDECAAVGLAVGGAVDNAVDNPRPAGETHASRGVLREAGGIEERPGAGGPWPRRSLLMPEIVTRAGWYRLLAERLDERPPLLDGLAREVLFRRAALDAVEQGAAPPYDVRPGLVPEMLTLYDALRRQHKTIDDFARLVGGPLEAGAEIDRGARRLLQQTHFLVAAFRAYEASLAGVDALDEHRLRERLLTGACARPLRKLVVTVPDQRADANGLWAADFDLITRLPHLDAIDIIATESVLATGFLERLLDTLPEIETRSLPDVEAPSPSLFAPPPDGRNDPLYFTARDREEELAAVARAVRDPDRTAVVYQRPLPYLYLARQVFGAAGPGGAPLPWQALDALPLAVEPYAAALDLVLTFAMSEYTRDAGIALLRSPFFRLVEHDGASPSDADIAAGDLFLREAGYLGGRDRLDDLAARLIAKASAPPSEDRAHGHGGSGAGVGSGSGSGSSRRGGGRSLPAVLALRLAAEALAPLEEPAAPSAHLAALDAFLTRFELALAPDDPLRERHLRARGAILSTIAGLRDAFTRYGERPGPFRDVAALLHRWIEGQTFNARVGQRGLHLVDVQTAVYGRFSRLFLVGVTEGEWPSSSARSIFYPGSLLRDLGWPGEADRRVTARAVFDDLLRLPREAVSVSTFALENDAIVRPSPFVEDLATAHLPLVRVAADAHGDARARHESLRTAMIANVDAGVATAAVGPSALPAPAAGVTAGMTAGMSAGGGAGAGVDAAAGAAAAAGVDAATDARVAAGVGATAGVDARAAGPGRGGGAGDGGEAAAWRVLREGRSGAELPAFHGQTSAVAPRAYSVTGVDRYLQCPFKYFAQDVLRLEEEPDQRPGLTALERGRFEHEVFQEFFIGWHAAGHGAITPDLLDEARAAFAGIVDALLERLPSAERDLERTRLLGSAVIPGLGERVFRFEAARPTPIIERLLEFKLDGEYLLPAPDEDEDADADADAGRETGREAGREAGEEQETPHTPLPPSPPLESRSPAKGARGDAGDTLSESSSAANAAANADASANTSADANGSRNANADADANASANVRESSEAAGTELRGTLTSALGAGEDVRAAGGVPSAAARRARAGVLVSLRGITDRIDLLADGTMRLIDYKAGKASTASSSIQLPVYVHCAEQKLDLHGGRHWRVSEAGYLAFGRQEPFVSVVSAGEDATMAVDKAVKRLSGTVQRIERGEFPVSPVEPHQCVFCGFAAVCRKDYVGD
jgi:RecB family exonuclease